MDDIQSPAIEGSESFIVFLSSPQGAVLLEPSQADVIITDSFQDSMYMNNNNTHFIPNTVVMGMEDVIQTTDSALSSQHAV